MHTKLLHKAKAKDVKTCSIVSTSLLQKENVSLSTILFIIFGHKFTGQILRRVLYKRLKNKIFYSVAYCSKYVRKYMYL